MGKLLDQEWLRGVLMTLIAAGILAAGLGAWQYWDANQSLQENRAQQIREEGGEVAVDSKVQVQMLFGSDMQRRELITQQSSAMILAGGGLILLALGWIGLNIMQGRRSTKPAPTQSTA